MRALLPYLLTLGLSVALLVAGAVADGIWDWASFLWMAWVVAALDHFMQRPGAAPPEVVARWVPLGLGLLHVPLLAGAVWTLAQGGWWLDVTVYLFACGLFFGQIMNSTAHELIHSPSRIRRRVGKWVYVTLLFGHQTTAHPLIHHVHVATPRDTNTARYDESWWRFITRAWLTSFRRGRQLEARRLTAKGRSAWDRRHPYWQYVGGGLGCLALAGAALGWAGVAAYVAICALAQLQLLMTDYVLHYGLRRRPVGDRYEPVNPRHSWNAPHVVSALLTLQGPRHSDHHANPQRGFHDLRLEEGVPMMPYALPVMVTIAFWPWYWRRMMNPRVHAVQGTNHVGPAMDPPTGLMQAPAE